MFFARPVEGALHQILGQDFVVDGLQHLLNELEFDLPPRAEALFKLVLERDFGDHRIGSPIRAANLGGTPDHGPGREQNQRRATQHDHVRTIHGLVSRGVRVSARARLRWKWVDAYRPIVLFTQDVFRASTPAIGRAQSRLDVIGRLP